MDGRLDLSQWDFEAAGDVVLVGTWEICWGELLEPDDACGSPWRPVPVRGLWSEESSGSPIGARGIATYRLRIALPPGGDRFALVAGGAYTASRLWIDGVERGRLGVVGRSAETTKTGVRNRAYDLSPRSEEVDLLVQVANFEFRSGGLRRLWYIGHENSIQAGLGRAILREAMVFAVGVVVGLAYLTLFAFGPSERARGYFGLASLVLGLRAVPASLSGFGELIAPWASFELLTRFEYLGTALALFAAAGYARTKVAGVAPPRTTKGLQLVALAMAAIVLFAPFSIVMATLLLQYALPVLLIGLFIGCYGKAWYQGVPGVRITAAASMIYLFVILHDIVRTMQVGAGAAIELYPYAMVLWIFAEGYELMQRFYQTFEKVELLSDELTEANFELQEVESAIVRFVPFDFLRLLGKQSIRDVDAGDRVRSRMSVLHCGLHATTVGQASSEVDFDFVNGLIARVEPIILHRGGFVNEFRGDGFQAFFPDAPREAVAAGVELVEAVGRFVDDRASSLASGTQVGVGIDTGPVLLGTVGSREHLLRGVVGQAVDGARRIEGLAIRARGRLLISATTRAGLDEADAFEIREFEDARAADVVGSTLLYEVERVERVERVE